MFFWRASQTHELYKALLKVQTKFTTLKTHALIDYVCGHLSVILQTPLQRLRGPQAGGLDEATLPPPLSDGKASAELTSQGALAT